MYTPVLELQSFDTLDLGQRLDVLRGLLEFLILNNRLWLRQNPQCPPMYEVAPSYKLKIRPFGLDTWQDIPRTLALGSGDCKDFACWRVAELREKGIPDVSPRIKVSESPKTGVVVYHIQVRRDLQLEDPSDILGMPKNLTAAQVKNLIVGRNGVDGILAEMSGVSSELAVQPSPNAAQYLRPRTGLEMVSSGFSLAQGRKI